MLTSIEITAADFGVDLSEIDFTATAVPVTPPSIEMTRPLPP
ncbi:MAG TPA: hypothetical protein VK636_07320 [Gemmatimonadaceae bacterium]|nr:hypothetical protein [Gemmatimonadaceae bacterium]